VLRFLSQNNLRTPEGFIIKLGTSMCHDAYITRLDYGVKSSKVMSGKNEIFENSSNDLNQTWYKYVPGVGLMV